MSFQIHLNWLIEIFYTVPQVNKTTLFVPKLQVYAIWKTEELGSVFDCLF